MLATGSNIGTCLTLQTININYETQIYDPNAFHDHNVFTEIKQILNAYKKVL